VWADALNAKLLATVALAHALLRPLADFRARVLLLTPGIVPALPAASMRRPFHAVERAVAAALAAYADALRAELAPCGVGVAHLKLGAFDCGGFGGGGGGSDGGWGSSGNGAGSSSGSGSGSGKNGGANGGSGRSRHARFADHGGSAATTTTNTNTATPYLALEGPPPAAARGWRDGVGGVRGSPLRVLHEAVFDALTVPRPRHVWYVGSGSRLYDFIGRWAPPGLVGWMLRGRGDADARWHWASSPYYYCNYGITARNGRRAASSDGEGGGEGGRGGGRGGGRRGGRGGEGERIGGEGSGTSSSSGHDDDHHQRPYRGNDAEHEELQEQGWVTYASAV
jgi:hypothetical protein